jgi:hypothetical protein
VNRPRAGEIPLCPKPLMPRRLRSNALLAGFHVQAPTECASRLTASILGAALRIAG